MAFRRSISARATFLSRRSNPSFSYIFHDKNDREHEESKRATAFHDHFNYQRRLFGSYMNNYNNSTWNSNNQKKSLFITGTSAIVFNFHRHMSTSIGEGSDSVEFISDVAAGIVSDGPSVEAVVSQVAAAPVMSEVAIAAADSALPVAALQYLIDNVHSFTGLNWWLSIALTTLLIRGATVPFLINQLKSTSKLTLMRPKMEEIKLEMEAKSMDPQAVADGQRRIKELFNEYGVTPLSPLKGLLIQGPIFISFFLAIKNMVEKVPSFKTGGAFWFTDLSVPDPLYIFPVLTALTFLATVEFNMQEGLEGNPVAGTMKKFSRVLAVLTVPFTMSFEQGIFCYWITSNLFSFAYGSVLRIPGVKKSLGVPDIPQPSPSQSSEQNISFFDSVKKASAAFQKASAARDQQAKPTDQGQSSAAELAQQAKPTEQKLSSAALSQRIRILERQVKQKKKSKKSS